MDERVGIKLASQLCGSRVGGWLVGKYIGWGKSAIVCEATKDDCDAAIKIYDAALVDRFGKEQQEARMRRQLQLVGKQHPHLIRLYDGGFCDTTGLFFLVMELVRARNLEDALQELPRDRIGPLIGQVASAARYLEDLGLVHRDIKPSNVLVTADFQKAVLADLGVIRPMAADRLTDSTQAKAFVATLRYSSPEYLLRSEEDTKDGWRGHTFYQLGAVLHDMIMRRPIFSEYSEPFARLVKAVCEEIPEIAAEDVHPRLVHLAKMCLIKDPALRVTYVNWECFDWRKEDRDDLDLIKARIRDRIELSQHYVPTGGRNSEREVQQSPDRLLHVIWAFLDRCVRGVCARDKVFPRRTIHHHIEEEPPTVRLELSFSRSTKHCLTRPLHVLLCADLLECNVQLVQIRWAAMLTEQAKEADAPDTMTKVFEGSFDEKAIEHQIDRLLHRILDRAQQLCTGTVHCGASAEKAEAPTYILFE